MDQDHPPAAAAAAPAAPMIDEEECEDEEMSPAEQLLTEHVAALRSSPPPLPFVRSVADPQPAGLTSDPAAPWWEVTVAIAGPAGQGYDWPYRVRLAFPPTYPAGPPSVRVLGVIHHAHVMPNGYVHPDLTRVANVAANCPGNEALLLGLAARPTDATGELGEGGQELLLHGSAVPDRVDLIQLCRAIHFRLFAAPLQLFPCDCGRRHPTQAEVESEWYGLRNENAERLRVIRAYRERCLHPDLFDLEGRSQQAWLRPELVAALKGGPRALTGAVRREAPGVYSVPLFADAFCDMLVEEVDHYLTKSGLPVRRPNSMNNYGLVVNEMGLEPLVDMLQEQVLLPIAQLCFPVEAAQFDGHHSFVVQYRPDQDLGLDMHTDDSDVTFNVCLGREFTGSGLTFCGLQGTRGLRRFAASYAHAKGVCVFHLGDQRHGADAIRSGERVNLIVWNRNHAYREAREANPPPFEPEDGPADPRCVSYTHDRDYGKYKPYPPGKEHLALYAWYPPPAAHAHDGCGCGHDHHDHHAHHEHHEHHEHHDHSDV